MAPSLAPLSFIGSSLAYLLGPYTSSFSAPGALKNDAPLDEPNMIKLATGILDAKPKILRSCVNPQVDFIQARYTLSTGQKPEQVVEIDIFIFENAESAQKALSLYLNMFTTGMQDILKTDNLLGQVSLQTAGSIFWVRDTVFVKLHAIATVSQTTVVPLDKTIPPKEPKPFPIPAPEPTKPPKMLVDFAAALDGHLSKGAVQPTSQRKPNTDLKGGVTSYKCERGKTFVVALANAKDAHVVKPAVPVDPSVVKLVQNGSLTGEYTFIGAKVGKTKVKIIVARADNLAVASTEIDVEVTKPEKYAK